MRLRIFVSMLLVVFCCSCGGGIKEYVRSSGMPAGAASIAVFPSRVDCGYMEEDGLLICKRCQCDGYKIGLLIEAEVERLASDIKVSYYHRPELEARGIERKIWKLIKDDKLVFDEVAELGEMSKAGLVLLSTVYCWERDDRSPVGAQGGRDSFSMRSGNKGGKPVKVRDKVGLDLALIDTDSGELVWRLRGKLHADSKQRRERHTHVYDSAVVFIGEMLEAFPLRSVKEQAPAVEAGE